MKKILIAVLATFALMSCGGPKTPVDEYIEVANKLVPLYEKAMSDPASADALEMEAKELMDQIDTIVRENKDYELTDADREKLYDFIAENAKMTGMDEDDLEDLKEDLNKIKTLGDMHL